jgi:hypothetical protein
MYRTTRTSTIYVTIAAATLVLVLLTSTTLTASVYAARIHHHSHRSIEGMPTSIGYQAYRNNDNPVSYQANGAPIGYQGYDPSTGYQANGATIGYQSYANNDNSGPISMHTASHHHNSDVSSTISRIFATKYW